MNKQAIIIAGTAIVSAAAGGAGGYFFAKKRVTDSLNIKYNEQMEEEIARTRQHYMAMSKKGDYADPADLVKKLHRETATHFSNEDSTLQRVAEGLAQSLGYAEPEAAPGEEDEDWEIVAAREQALMEDNDAAFVSAEFDLPRVISRDEFIENEKGHVQVSWVWFVMDNTLMNEHKEPVDDVTTYIGDNALNRIGQGGSKDPNVVFVRNDHLEMDFEILRHRGTYEEEVGPRRKSRDRRSYNRFRPEQDSDD